MTTIPVDPNQLRHVRKTITFTGGANNGNLGDAITAMTCTGVVLVEAVVCRVTTALVCSASSAVTLKIRFGTNTYWGDSLSAVEAVDTIFTTNALGSVSDVGVLTADSVMGWAITQEDLKVLPQDDGGGADITAGTLVIDCWYRPITDDGALAGDDIDGGIDGYTFEEALRIVLAALAGKVDGGGTTSIAIRDVQDTKDRISATVTAVGDRTAVTLDGS